MDSPKQMDRAAKMSSQGIRSKESDDGAFSPPKRKYTHMKDPGIDVSPEKPPQRKRGRPPKKQNPAQPPRKRGRPKRKQVVEMSSTSSSDSSEYEYYYVDYKVDYDYDSDSSDNSNPSSRNKGTVERIIGQNDSGHYYVKFVDVSYIHSDFKVLETEEIFSTPSRFIPGLKVNEEIRPHWFHIDRIITQSRTAFLVKWKELGYQYATWEDESSFHNNRAVVKYYVNQRHSNPTRLPPRWVHPTEYEHIEDEDDLTNFLVKSWTALEQVSICEVDFPSIMSAFEYLAKRYVLRGPFLIITNATDFSSTTLNVVIFDSSALDVIIEHEFTVRDRRNKPILGQFRPDVVVISPSDFAQHRGLFEEITWRWIFAADDPGLQCEYSTIFAPDGFRQEIQWKVTNVLCEFDETQRGFYNDAQTDEMRLRVCGMSTQKLAFMDGLLAAKKKTVVFIEDAACLIMVQQHNPNARYLRIDNMSFDDDVAETMKTFQESEEPVIMLVSVIKGVFDFDFFAGADLVVIYNGACDLRKCTAPVIRLVTAETIEDNSEGGIPLADFLQQLAS